MTLSWQRAGLTRDEIAQAEEEGIASAHLEALESGNEASAEALVSMREASTRLTDVRKDRGFKGPAVAAAGAGKPSGGAAKAEASILSKKSSGKHACFDCFVAIGLAILLPETWCWTWSTES